MMPRTWGTPACALRGGWPPATANLPTAATANRNPDPTVGVMPTMAGAAWAGGEMAPQPARPRDGVPAEHAKLNPLQQQMQHQVHQVHQVQHYQQQVQQRMAQMQQQHRIPPPAATASPPPTCASMCSAFAWPPSTHALPTHPPAHLAGTCPRTRPAPWRARRSAAAAAHAPPLMPHPNGRRSAAGRRCAEGP